MRRELSSSDFSYEANVKRNSVPMKADSDSLMRKHYRLMVGVAQFAQ